MPNGPLPVPECSSAPIPTEDPLFGHAEPIRLSEVDPRAGHDMTNPIDRIIRRERDRVQLMNAQSYSVGKVHAMDLFDIRHQLDQLIWYMKSQVLALRPLSGLIPGLGEVVNPHLGLSLPGPGVNPERGRRAGTWLFTYQ